MGRHFLSPPSGRAPGKMTHIVIFYDPNYSPDENWELYADEVDIWTEDPDQPKSVPGIEGLKYR